MPWKQIVAVALAIAAVAAVVILRRRQRPAYDYETWPPLPHQAREPGKDMQEPSYYGGEQLGATSGLEHFPAQQ